MADVYLFKTQTKRNASNYFPEKTGNFSIHLDIDFSEFNEETYKKWSKISWKKIKESLDKHFAYIEDKKLRDNKIRLINRSLKNYKKFININNGNYILSSFWPTTNIKENKQHFSLSQVRSSRLNVEKMRAEFEVMVLCANKPKNYGDPKEVKLFLGPSTIKPISKKHNPLIFYRTLGVYYEETGDNSEANIYIPFEMKSSNSNTPLFLGDFKEFIDNFYDSLKKSEIDVDSVKVDIDVHSPLIGALKITTTAGTVVSQVMTPFSKDETTKENIAAGDAFDPNVELELRNITEITLFVNDNIQVVTNIYKE